MEDDECHWQLMGEYYGHRLMDDEAVEGLDKEGSGITPENSVLV